MSYQTSGEEASNHEIIRQREASCSHRAVKIPSEACKAQHGGERPYLPSSLPSCADHSAIRYIDPTRTRAGGRVMSAAPTGVRMICRCTHTKWAHTHYRRSTDCTQCRCPRWRPSIIATIKWKLRYV